MSDCQALGSGVGVDALRAVLYPLIPGWLATVGLLKPTDSLSEFVNDTASGVVIP